MFLYIKYNETSKYGPHWNLSNFSLHDIYFILGQPKDLLVLPCTAEDNLSHISIQSPNSFLEHIEARSPDFACVDCFAGANIKRFSNNEVRALERMLPYDERIDRVFASIGNSFVWYSHDEGEFSAVCRNGDQRVFFRNILKAIAQIANSIVSNSSNDETFEELYQCAKRGLRVNTRDIFFDEEGCYVTFDCHLSGMMFCDLLCDNWNNSRKICVKL